MTIITTTVEWRRNESLFSDNRYSRSHVWSFDGGLEVAASSSPHIVPLPMSDASAIDPEEAFVAALSSCHMLCFLSLAAKQGFTVDKYIDEAYGEIGRNETGRVAITKVTLRPKIEWSSPVQPSSSQVHDLHKRAHDQCFIANSAKTDVRIQATP